MVDRVGGKQPQASVPSKPHHTLPVSPGFFAPALVTVISLPIGFLFALGIQGTPLTYVISVVGIGILTALDLKTGLLRSVLGFAATFLTVSYLVQNSTLFPGIAPGGQYASLVVALPPSIGVFLSTILFSRKQRYRIVKQNILATLATGAGIVVGASSGGGNGLVGANIVASSLFIGIGLGANCLQMIVLFMFDKIWQAKKYSMAVLPTAFFSYNAIIGYEYFTTLNPTLAYIFFSSFGFLPILILSAMGASGLSVKMLKAPTKSSVSMKAPPPLSPPRISFSGDHAVKFGHPEAVKITTESEGGPRDMMNINAVIQTPAGKKEPVRLLHSANGKYSITYQAAKPGNYNIHITATGRGNATSKESFSFTVQAPPPSPQPRAAPPPPKLVQNRPQPSAQPAPVQHPQPLPSLPRPAPPMSKPPAISYTRQGIPALTINSWDPKVWVGQEIHGYHVVEHVATGASGYVLRATFGQAGTEVALKIPILKTSRPRGVNEPTAGTMTLNETMTEATRLLELSGQSKYVVQIRGILVDRLNVQEILKGDTSLYYRNPPAIVMEFMKGGTAKKLIEDVEYEPLYYSEKWGGIVVLLGQMISVAMDMIHKAGFVHLDVKPQNIMFNTKPPVTGHDMIDKIASESLLPKLGDLGSAVKKGGKVVQFTSEYAPGEQVLGDPAEPSMDVYALGASLYAMLTRTPVHSAKLIEAMNSVTTNPDLDRAFRDLESVWDGFKPDFSKIDSKFSAIVGDLKDMLARDPDDRPDAGSVAASLQKLVDKKGLLS
jgi:serine/threonine protein kinase